MERNASPLWFVAAVVLVVFVAFSGWVVATDPWGLLPLLREKWTAQLGGDLTIALTLLWIMIVRDPRFERERLWPWMLATAPLGSIAPLTFLVLHHLRGRAPSGSIAQ